MKMIFSWKMILDKWRVDGFCLKIFILRILAYDDVMVTKFSFFGQKLPFFHTKLAIEFPKMTQLCPNIGLKVDLYVFFKIDQGIFDFNCHRKVGSAPNNEF